MPTVTPEQVAVLALVRATHRLERPWHRTSALIEGAGSAADILEGRLGLLDVFEREEAEALRAEAEGLDFEESAQLAAAMRDAAVQLVTVLDADYPANLRQVYDRPPFLCLRGAILSEDERAVAVVGTREATDAGLRRSDQLARELTSAGVTVLSGLARGIDTAAHEGALEAGGRTIAVLGAGILSPIYPPENADLASRIMERGAVVSQFWPQALPTRKTFPMRNAVMSGMGLGTVVVEASHTSGARMQARMAVEHGRRLFLLRSLVREQDWTNRFVDHPATTVVDSVEDILGVLTEIVETRAAEQLTLS